jgi:hypothetical protein
MLSIPQVTVTSLICALLMDLRKVQIVPLIASKFQDVPKYSIIFSFLKDGFDVVTTMVF